MQKTLVLNKWGSAHQMSFELNQYADNGNLYVGLISHDEGYPEPWQNLTVNIGVPCKANCAYIDTNNNGSEIVEWLITNQLGALTGRMHTSGWCTYPEFMFDMDKLKEYLEV